MSGRNPWTVPTPKTSDPGRACGTTGGYAPLPRCANCPHIGEVHAISETTKRRTACSAADPGKCPCRTYQPEVDGGLPEV